MPGTGGTPEQLIAVEDGEEAHGPQMLPSGDAVLYTLALGTRQWDAAQIVVEDLATGERTVLIDGGRDGRYLPTGHLVYVLNGVLFGVPFDPVARAVTGRPVSLIEGIRDSGARPTSTIGEVCEVVSGGTPKTGNPDFWDGEIPWVTPKGSERA